MIDHATHGKDSAEEYPNATWCPCAGQYTLEDQLECAAFGCRYCAVMTKGKTVRYWSGSSHAYEAKV